MKKIKILTLLTALMITQTGIASAADDMATLSYQIISDEYKIGVFALANINQPTEINYGLKSDCKYFDIYDQTKKDVPLTDIPETKLTVFPIKEKDGQVQTIIIVETSEPAATQLTKLSENCSIRLAQMIFTRKSFNTYFKENETKVFSIGNSVMTVKMNHIEKAKN